MNLSNIVGIIFALIVFLASVLTATPSWKIFLDIHAILIVMGGTLAASLVSFRLSVFTTVIKLFWRKIIGKTDNRFEKVIDEIVQLSKKSRENPSFLKENAKFIVNPFLKEAVELTLNGGISPEVVDELLAKRAETHFRRYEDEAKIFKTIAKFPPAFGLLGTTLGMIALLQNMGGPDSYKTLGPSMAIGLVATLYGIALANFIFIPIGENLEKLNREDETMREIVRDGVQLLRSKVHYLIVREHLLSHLLPNERAVIQKKAS